MDKDGSLECQTCHQYFPLQGRKIFFAIPPTNLSVNPELDPADKSKWTPLRLAQHGFLDTELKKVSKTSLICDLGAGPGQSQEIFKHFPNYLSVDFYPYPHVNIVADIEKRLPFQSNTFDVVLSLNTFEHIHDVYHLLAEIHRILKPGGRLIAVTPFMLGLHQEPYDFHRFTHYEIRRMLKDTKFRDVSINSLATAYDWLSTSETHFFMKLFDTARQTRPWPKFALMYAAVKLAWNIQKYSTRILKPLLSLNCDDTNTLGYGFVSYKS